MNVSEVIYNLFNALLTVFINYFFFSAFAKSKQFRLRGLYLVVICIVYILALLFLNNSMLSFTVIIILDFLLSYLFNIKLVNRIFLCIAINLMYSFTELIVAVASSNILNVEMSVLKTGFYFISGMLMSKLLTFLIVAIIKIGKHKLPIRKLGIVWIYISILPITSFILIFIMIDYIYLIESSMMQTVTVAGFTMLIFANVFIFYVIDKICDYFEVNNKLDIAGKMIETQKLMYQSLYDNQAEIKKIKHDISNIMLGIKNLLNSGKIDKINQYLDENIGKFQNKDFVSGNSIIDVLIHDKTKIANEKGINIEVDLILDSPLEIDPIDFSIMIGNAIDNAIEATEKTLHKTVNISIHTKNNNLIVVIENPVIENVDINNLETTKKDKHMHGIGIAQMMNLSQKYDGTVVFDCNDCIFTTSFVLNNKEH